MPLCLEDVATGAMEGRDTERIQAAYITKNCRKENHKEHVEEFLKFQRVVKGIYGRYPYTDATDPGVSANSWRHSEGKGPP